MRQKYGWLNLVKGVTAVLVTMTVLAGCASKPVETHQYLLPAPAFEVADRAFDGRVAIGSVRVAEFLTGTSMIVETLNNELFATRQHRWADRLSEQLERQVRQGLHQRFPESQWVPLLSTGYLRVMDYRLDLHVDAFQMSSTGEAHVRVQWHVRDASQEFVTSGVIEERSELAQDGYPAMVDALGAAWHAVLRQLGDAIAELPERSTAQAR
ncbi:MAG: membrane integrity-associated transporter subunit PqiC [Idiomarina sp.]|nr:membrane integrity-associated transporter subunit PqiC [Idiomarina sp.]